MSKTVITVIVAVIIVAAVSYGFYAYTRPVIAPIVTDASATTNVNNSNTGNVNTTVVTNTVNTNNTEAMTKIYLVALDDNGKSGAKVGCGDSLVAVEVPYGYIKPASDAHIAVQSTLEKLLAIKDAHYGESGLYSALYQSTLTVQNVSIANGVATVALSGSITSGGACDSPRIKEQLVETVKAVDTAITTVEITVDGIALDTMLSGSGQ